MRIRTIKGIMLTLLLIGMLTVAFNTAPTVADTGTDELSGGSSTIQDADGDNSSNPMDSQESFLKEGFDRNASAEDNPKPCSVDENRWNFNMTNEWTDFAKVDDDSAELVIGVNNGKPNSYADIAGLIDENGGDLVGTVSMGGEIRAVSADIPIVAVSSFVAEVWDAGLSKYIEPNMKFQACFVPNDPRWSLQWGPRMIEADYAWNTTLGDPSVLVAVIDTGIDWNHPDLAANYVPLGYDWVNDDTDPMDDEGHGTHCAGIIAAVIDNSVGIAGLAQAKIMAEKGFDEYGDGYEDDLANAIIHAVDQGANILSNSWRAYGESALIHEAVKYAYDHGVLVVAAAGNEATSMKVYPAGYDEAIAVTATDEYDNPASFTNFGDWVEIAAPGVDIYSTVWNDAYTYMDGTSMSTPHVAGVAALVWSQFPKMTRDQVRLQLRFTAEDLGDPGFDDYYGYGRINARRAVEQAPPDHDLVILDWERPRFVEPGALAIINTTVFNFGTSNETDITVQLFANGSIVDSATIDFLEIATSETVNCTWTPTVEGTYNLTSYILPVPSETLTANNVVTAMISVGYFKYVLFDQTHGTDSIVMYNTWATALPERGYTVDVHTSGSITSGILMGCDAFVIPQAHYSYSSDELSAIQNFVAMGGGFLVIGDDEPYIYTNLTGFAGITWSGGGCGGYTSDITPHPVTEGVTTTYFGAPVSSLYVTDPAQDLIRDSCGYVMLVASEVGSGKVLGIADEDSICDGPIGDVDNFQLAINMIDWLAFRPEHDVVVTLDTPPYVEPGESSLLNATVHNRGLSNETDVELFLFINGTAVNSAAIPELVTGSSYKLGYLWTPVVEAMYNVTGYAVPVQNETITENNLAWAYVYVGFLKKAFVLHSAGTYYANIINNWEMLNNKWYTLGSEFIYIDYTTLNIADITYDDIAVTGADVLIVSCAFDPWMGWEFTNSEIDAIKRYVLEGHGLIATAGTLYYGVPNNNRLATLFGLKETVTWGATSTDLLHLQDPMHPLFVNVPNPYTFPQVGTSLPSDGRWDGNELDGGTYVALGHYEESAIVVHRGLVYVSPWLETIPSYYHHHLQLLYNAITWSSYQKPEHELVVSLEAPTSLKPSMSTLLNATVSNFGLNNETDVELFLLIDGTTVENARVPELPTGSSYTLSYLWIPTVEAVYNVTAYAPLVPEEEFAANNFETKIILVKIIVAHVVFEEAHAPAYTIGSNPASDFTGGYSEFADYLTAFGCTVSTIDPGTIIDSTVLDPVDVLVIVAPMESYLMSEIDAIETWVKGGGKLLLISDWGPFGFQARTIATRFGIDLAGDVIQDIDENAGDTFAPYYEGANLLPHRITAGVARVEMYAGDGVLSAPVDEIPLIVTDSDGTATWYDGSPALGVSVMSAFDGGSAGSGRLVIITDSNVWDSVLDVDGDGDVGFYDSDNEVLALNSVDWLAVIYEHDVAVSLDAPEFIEPGDSSLLNATVHNRGLSNETDVELFLLINGSIVDNATIPELLTGSSYTLSYLWTPTVEGVCNVTVYAPPVPGENVNANNQKSKFVEISCWISIFVTEDNWPIPPDNDLDYYMYNDDPRHPIEWAHWYNLSSPVLEATLQIYVYDVDSPNEVNEVYFNGLYIGQLQGADGQWTLNSFTVPTSYVQNGINIVTAYVDVTHPGAGYLAMAVDWANLIIHYAKLEHELISSLEAPASLALGDSVLLNATATNLGLNNETNVELQLLINGTIADFVVVPELLTNSFYTLSYAWTPTVEATYNITAYVPPAPDETFTENNVETKTVSVVPMRDVAIISVTTSDAQVYEGQIVNVTVVAKNEGKVTETFDVTACYDTSVIGAQTVTNLTVGANVTLTFSWDTTGVEPRLVSYTINAVATLVPGEIDTADNTYVDGGVKVKMVGDVNGDGKVTITDVTIAAIAFGSRLGDPNWNPNADLNQDGKVNIVDLVIIGVNFGKKLPLRGHPAQATWVEPDLVKSVPICDTFVVDIMINITDPPGAAMGLFGFEYKLFWNMSILQCERIQYHSPWPIPPAFLVINETGMWSGGPYDGCGYHWLAIAAMWNQTPFTGVTSLCTYTFHVVGNGSCALDLYDTEFTDDTATIIISDTLGIGTTVDGYFTNVV